MRDTGRAVLFMGGVATASMAAYHFVLPSHMQWGAAMQDVPGMVTWGLFAINFDFSVLLLGMGILTCAQALGPGPSTRLGRVAVLMPALFWTLHALYMVAQPLPIPDFLATLRTALQAFTVAIVLLHWAGGVALLRSSTPAPVRTTPIVASGLLGGAALMGVVMTTVLLSMPTLKPAPTDQASAPPAVEVEQGRADRLGLPGIETLATEGAARIFEQGDRVTDEAYLARWPQLRNLLVGPSEPGSALPEGASACNLAAQRRRLADDLEGAEIAIEAALLLEPDEALHQLQHGYLLLAQLRAESNPMARWALSNKATKTFARALELDGALDDARLFLAYAYERAPEGFGGDRQAAMGLLDEAIESGNAPFVSVRARFRLEREQLEAGLEDAKRAMGRGHYHAGTFSLAARTALQLGEREDALDLAAFAVRMNPQATEAWEVVHELLGLDPQQDPVAGEVAER